MNEDAMYNAQTALENSDDFIKDFFLPIYTCSEETNRASAISSYINSWYNGDNIRKPAPGFYPEIYAKYHALIPASSHQDEPFAHYIQSGKPNGPWQENVFEPTKNFEYCQNQLKCAVNIHVFYPDLFKVILEKLQSNHLKFDILISVTSEDHLRIVKDYLSTFSQGNSVVKLTPNLGRDVGPFFTAFGEILQQYDVVGHFHTKKTPQVPSVISEAWFNFLLENMIGKKYSMADQIINKFKENDNLGIVFPDDPHLIGWTKNKPIADQLASRLGMNNLPNGNFSFPVGNMFWVRPKAIQSLFDLKLTWDNYPTEPVPGDGTLIHALERILPLVVEKLGFKRLVTYVPGVGR